MTPDFDPATVLIVEDEQPLADLFAQFLLPSYTVHTAYSGTEGLDLMSNEVDVVLLDRRMPGLSGEEVLRAIREDGYDCRVAMVSAVTPDIDVIEMGFDDYLTKPVTQAELNGLVEDLLELHAADTTVREYYRLSSKKAALDVERSVGNLSENEEREEYERLTSRLTELETEPTRNDEAASEEDLGSLLDRFRSRSHGG